MSDGTNGNVVIRGDLTQEIDEIGGVSMSSKWHQVVDVVDNDEVGLEISDGIDDEIDDDVAVVLE